MPEIATMQHDWHDRQADVIGLRISNTTTESSEKHADWNVPHSPDRKEFISDGYWGMTRRYRLFEHSWLAKPSERFEIQRPIFDFRDILFSFCRRVPNTVADDAREFANKHGLWHHLILAHLKVFQFFPKPRNLKTVLTIDPESDESWLSVKFVTEGSLDDIIAARKKYRRFWVRNVPVTKRLMIRLMYDID